MPDRTSGQDNSESAMDRAVDRLKEATGSSAGDDNDEDRTDVTVEGHHDRFTDLEEAYNGYTVYCVLTHSSGVHTSSLRLICALCRLFQISLPPTLLDAAHIYFCLASATGFHIPERMGRLADALTAKGGHSLRAGPRFRRVSEVT